MSMPYVNAGLATLAGGLGLYAWKSGVVQRYFAKETAPVVDQFVKTAPKRLTSEEKKAIIQKLSGTRLSDLGQSSEKLTLSSMRQAQASFYLKEKMSARMDQIMGRSHRVLPDGQRYPTDKVLDLLERKVKKEPLALKTLDEESKNILAAYEKPAREAILESSKRFADSRPMMDLESGKISVNDIDNQLENLALEKKFKAEKAPRTIKKYMLQKAEYRRLKQSENLTDSEKQFIQQFEDHADAMEQTIRANKRHPDFNLVHDEKLKPGFMNSSIHNFYRESELTQFKPDQDPVLQANIEAFKAKLAADPLINHPTLKGSPLRDKQICHLLMEHVNDAFPVDIKDTEEIFKALGSYRTRNLLGDYIAQGVGVCRHKYLLTKAIADKVGLDVSLNSGMYGDIGHAWNTVKIGNETYLLDAHHDCFIPWGGAVEKLYRQGKTLRDRQPLSE